MATEQGIVIKIDSSAAWVKTVKSGACKGCTARGSCHSLGGGDDVEVKAINDAGAKVGDRIVLSIETSSLLKATFLLYVFPILVLLAGALMGQGIAPYIGVNPSGFAAVVGFALLGWVVRRGKLYRKGPLGRLLSTGNIAMQTTPSHAQTTKGRQSDEGQECA